MTVHESANTRQFDWTMKYLAVSALVLTVVVLVAYFIDLRVSFVGDDWIFYEIAGRLSWSQYLIKYFDPRAQTAWYRPLQGVFFRLAYDAFGTNQMPYHLGNVLFHLANSFALFAVVVRAIGKWRIGFVSALLYASFPTAVEGVFKPGVVDPLTTLCFLIAVWFWLGYLRHLHDRDYWLAFVFFVLALLSKEIAVTIPITFFLIDRFFVRASTDWKELFRRYFWFGIVVIAYIPIELIVVSRSVFVRHEGYSASLFIVSNLLDYLGSLVFPWLLPQPLNYISIVIAAGVLAYFVVVRKADALLPIVASAVFGILPILPFPFVSYRFSYLSLTSTAILFALAFDLLWRKLSVGWLPRALALGLAIVVVISGAGVSNAAVDFGEFGRVMRVPFRNVSQAHPTFPEDTLLYFIYPPLPGPSLSGMFFWRYGKSVQVGADDNGRMAGLSDHATTFVYVFDDQNNQKELPVEKNVTVQATPALPVTFSVPIRLEAYEMVSASVRSDQAFVLLLYWRGVDRIKDDYTVFANLVDASGRQVAAYAKEPRRGKASTSSWVPGELVVDPVQISVAGVAPGSYRLEIGLYDAGTQARFAIVDSNGKPIADRIAIEPIRITE